MPVSIVIVITMPRVIVIVRAIVIVLVKAIIRVIIVVFVIVRRHRIYGFGVVDTVGPSPGSRSLVRAVV